MKRLTHRRSAWVLGTLLAVAVVGPAGATEAEQSEETSSCQSAGSLIAGVVLWGAAPLTSPFDAASATISCLLGDSGESADGVDPATEGETSDGSVDTQDTAVWSRGGSDTGSSTP